MRRRLVAAALVAAALAGCFAPASVRLDADESSEAAVVPVAAFADAVGDAFEPGVHGTLSALCPSCPASEPVPRGPPAPYFDLAGVTIEESASTVLVDLAIARLDAGFRQLDGAADAHRTAAYTVCFAPGVDDPDRCAVAAVAADGASVQVQGSFWLRSHACNEWSLCVFEVPAALVPGTPAAVRFEVPKSFLAYDGWDLRRATVTASATWTEVNAVSPAWHTALSVDSPARKYHHHDGGQGDVSGTADEAGPHDVAFALRPAPAPPVADAVRVTLAPGAFSARGTAYDRPALDLLGVDLGVEGGDVVARWTVASLEAMPDHDLLYFLDFGVRGKEVWEIGFLKEASGAYGYAGHCISYECAGDFGGDHEAHDMSAHFSRLARSEVTLGTPGRVEVRAPLATFPSIVPGDETNFLTAEALYADASVWVGRYGDGARADWHKMSTIDERWGAPVLVFPVPGATGPAPQALRRA